jgi:hypothetical protein
LLDTKFEAAPNQPRFTGDEIRGVQAWEPQVLVLPLSLALTLADQKQRGCFDILSLDTAIVALTSTEDSPIADHHRDLLWQAFEIPLFEQLCNPDGRVIAAECEVHDGLHLLTAETVAGELIAEACPCGAETPRIRRSVPIQVGALTKAAGR